MLATKVMLVDDDERIVASLRRGLSLDGYDVTVANNGMVALDAIRKYNPDIIILDVTMPVMDGIEACPYIKSLTDAPILMLTARDEVSDKVKGLEAGADDYLVKPFAYEEFTARLRALLRRSGRGAKADTTIDYADLQLDTARRIAIRAGKEVELSSKEYELLRLLITNPETVLTREFLMDRVWGWDFDGESNVLEVYISYLRGKLDASGLPKLIHTIRGTGYVLRVKK